MEFLNTYNAFYTAFSRFSYSYHAIFVNAVQLIINRLVRCIEH